MIENREDYDKAYDRVKGILEGIQSDVLKGEKEHTYTDARDLAIEYLLLLALSTSFSYDDPERLSALVAGLGKRMEYILRTFQMVLLSLPTQTKTK